MWPVMEDKDIEEYNKIGWELKWNKQFEYPSSQRELIKGLGRHYSVSGEKLPSVTTILSKTQTKEKQESLANWRAKVGEAEATRIMDQAAARGTAMHTLLEHYLLGEKHADLTDVGQQATMMAEKVIEEGIKGHLDEIWGSEVTVWYPDLFAGATDVVGVYDGEEVVQGPMFTVVRCSSKGACSLLHKDVVDKVIFGVEVLVSHDKVSAYGERCICMCFCVLYGVYSQ